MVAAIVGAVWGWIMSLSLGRGRREVEEIRGLLDRERAEAERAIARLRRQIEDLEGRTKDQTEIFQTLPDIVRQMFSASGRRGVGSLALKLVDQLFHPEQSAIFVVRRPRETGVLDDDFMARTSHRRLVIAACNGLRPPLTQGFELDFGLGQVGYVAEHRLPMDASDFGALSGHLRKALDAGPAGLRADVVVPMEDEMGLVGVFCMGGARSRHGQEKRLLKMVAELTTIALTYVNRLKTTQEAADMDGLTGVYNKRYLQTRLGDEMHRAERENVPLSLLILDIDHFKNYNDTNGHLAGDELLKKLGHILRASTREDDVAARYGGEEFVILYPGAPKAMALKAAESLRLAVESYPFAHRGRQPLGAVTISGGVATFPEDSRSGTELIRCADQALYEAKASGRNRILAAKPTFLT